MPQFLIGFWCGCAAAALVGCLLYAMKKRQLEEAADRQPTVEKEEKSDAKEPKAFDARVLLIDDSRLSRTVMKEFLSDKALEIHEAEDGTESLKLVQKYAFDLIFLDQCMPGIDADETLHRLRTEGGVAREVPVVAVGSAVRKENEKVYLAKGYAACMGKPIQGNRISEIVEQVLSKKQSSQIPKGFSYETGLDNFDGNESVYRETLVLFADLWKERKEQLQCFLREGNLQEYAILIHAIKGDSRTLGAHTLGELAYAQELKAKEGDGEAIENSMEALLEEGDKTAAYFVRIGS